MNAPDTLYRRNFLIALVLHAVVISGLIGFEYFLSGARFDRSTSEVIPAVLLGELPAGKGSGLGEYKAPEPPGPGPTEGPPVAPSPAPNLADDEGRVPPPKVVPPSQVDPNEIGIPIKPTPKKLVINPKPLSVPRKNEKTVTPTTTAAKNTASTAKTTTTGTGHGSIDDIVKRFNNSGLSSSVNGSARGDGKAAGGGTSTTGRVGLPNGAADGVVGGIGQGTPNWQYFQHIHEVLYKAWEQPVTALDKGLITTVTLRIATDGSVADVTVKIRSGNKLMDDSVLAAVRKVPRLDPPPAILVRGEFAVIAVNFQVEG